MHACAPIDVRTSYVFGQRCRSRYSNNNVQPFHLNYISNEPFANESGERRCQSQRVWYCSVGTYSLFAEDLARLLFQGAILGTADFFQMSVEPSSGNKRPHKLEVYTTVPRSMPPLTAGAVCRTCMTSRAFFSASTIDDR